MRELEETRDHRRHIHNERAIGRAVFIVALLLVAAEVCGALGLW